MAKSGYPRGLAKWMARQQLAIGGVGSRNFADGAVSVQLNDKSELLRRSSSKKEFPDVSLYS